jgi:hypothetical protein
MNIKKQTLFFFVIVLFIACNGNSVSRIPKNEILGDVPSILYQKEQQDSIREAKTKAASDKIEDEGKMIKLAREYMEETEKAQAKFEEALMKEGEKLKGRDVPFSLAESQGYEITSLKITGVTEKGEVSVGYTVKLTDVSKINFVRPNMGLAEGRVRFPIQFVDKAGNVLGKSTYYLFFSRTKVKNASDLTNGMEVDYYNDIPVFNDSKGYSDFAKIEFLPSDKLYK